MRSAGIFWAKSRRGVRSIRENPRDLQKISEPLAAFGSGVHLRQLLGLEQKEQVEQILERRAMPGVCSLARCGALGGTSWAKVTQHDRLFCYSRACSKSTSNTQR